MTQKLDLNKMGLEPLNNMESNNINGGGFWGDWVLSHVVDYAVEGLWELAKASASRQMTHRQKLSPHM